MIGTVYLNVADLDKLVTFYQDIIGLKLHRLEDNVAYLGVGGDDLLVLSEKPQAKRHPNSTGLYHFALLVPSRAELARVLNHFVETRAHLQGMSDHIVSEAIYLADPEGNGIEIYQDRPESFWYKDGQFQLTTLRLNTQSLMNELSDVPWQGLHPDTRMGHIHLHVSAIPEAEAFYTALLGMDIMMNVGSATFMSYDGYHHHIGANIWGGLNAAPDNALGLDRYVLQSSNADAILSRFKEAGIEIKAEGDGYLVTDPSNNHIWLMQM